MTGIIYSGCARPAIIVKPEKKIKLIINQYFKMKKKPVTSDDYVTITNINGRYQKGYPFGDKIKIDNITKKEFEKLKNSADFYPVYTDKLPQITEQYSNCCNGIKAWFVKWYTSKGAKVAYSGKQGIAYVHGYAPTPDDLLFNRKFPFDVLFDTMAVDVMVEINEPEDIQI